MVENCQIYEALDRSSIVPEVNRIAQDRKNPIGSTQSSIKIQYTAFTQQSVICRRQLQKIRFFGYLINCS